MKADFEKLAERYDSMIRQGQTDAVRTELTQWNLNKVPRAQASTFAQLARRVNLPDLALLWLRPYVRPKLGALDPATPREMAIYASALIRVGVIQEAQWILEKITEQTPEALLHLSAAHMHQWNYSAAVPILKRYVLSADVSDYDRMIGKLNLAACYRFQGDSPHEQTLLEEILRTTREQGWVLLQRHALELAGQAAIGRHQWTEAEQVLAQAEAVSKEHKLSDFLVRKWRALVRLQSEGPTAGALERLSAFRKEALEAKDWESVRECDFYRGTILKDSDLTLFVYFGTSFGPYRKRLENVTKDWLKIPNSYSWRMTGEPSPLSFDLNMGQEKGGAAELKRGQLLQRLFFTLASDFYRPFPTGTLFSKLYPGEYFDVVSSPTRIKVMITKLRAWFEANKMPIQIASGSGLYKLEATAPYELTVYKDLLTRSAFDEDERMETLSRLRQAWLYKSFSTSQAAESIGISVDKARSLLKWAAEKKRVYQTGQGRATLYRFSK